MVYNSHVRKEDMIKFISIIPDIFWGAFWGFIKVFAVYWFAYIAGIIGAFGFFYVLANIFL